ncbi:MAG TPA: hypothetical protein VGN11_04270 [Candidatus Baltobacteraceae bacterium]|nr:hypothetical protein [Candidatus Baltobacteraceae bacterium]
MPSAPAGTSPSPGASAPAGAPAAPSPTPPPITANPQNVQVPVGTTQTVTVNGVLGVFTATAQNPQLVDVGINQDTRTISIMGKTPGATSITVTGSRGVTGYVGVRVAYNAGTIPQFIRLRITGDPASPEYVRETVARQIVREAQLQPGAQIVVSPDDVPIRHSLEQDNSQVVDVSVLEQGNAYFSVQGTTRVQVENIAAPRISPDSLMVSDYPERLTENGVLFTADLHSSAPSRFLYFHYNPPGQADRRIVLMAENHSGEPATVQFISGRGGPSTNEMDVGHTATRDFLVSVIQNQGRLITIPAHSTIALTAQALPTNSIIANLLQLRVLSGGDIHLTLVAQNASDDPATALTTGALLMSTVRHARGIYGIPEFHYAAQWNVNDAYLELPIGQIPLPNRLQGEALAGDYGVLQSFVVNVMNPTNAPQAIALYENPRGGRSTATYIIDGVLVQSHQVPPFSRYKVRQYVIPAKGFVRVTIVTMPEAGSSYPLRLIFAPDDGSISPGAPGSPVY